MPRARARSPTWTSRRGSVSLTRWPGAGPSTTSRPTSTTTRWGWPPGSWRRPGRPACGASSSTPCCTRTTTPCPTTCARPRPRRSCAGPGWPGRCCGRRPTTRTSRERPTRVGWSCRTASTRRSRTSTCATWPRWALVLGTDGHEGRTYDLCGAETLTVSRMAHTAATVLGHQVTAERIDPAEWARGRGPGCRSRPATTCWRCSRPTTGGVHRQRGRPAHPAPPLRTWADALRAGRRGL